MTWKPQAGVTYIFMRVAAQNHFAAALYKIWGETVADAHCIEQVKAEHQVKIRIEGSPRIFEVLGQPGDNYLDNYLITSYNDNKEAILTYCKLEEALKREVPALHVQAGRFKL